MVKYRLRDDHAPRLSTVICYSVRGSGQYLRSPAPRFPNREVLKAFSNPREFQQQIIPSLISTARHGPGHRAGRELQETTNTFTSFRLLVDIIFLGPSCGAPGYSTDALFCRPYVHNSRPAALVLYRAESGQKIDHFFLFQTRL